MTLSGQRPARLMVHTENTEEVVAFALVIDPERRDGPAPNTFARGEHRLGALEFTISEGVDNVKDLVEQLQRGTRVAEANVADASVEIGGRLFGEFDLHRPSLVSMRRRTSSASTTRPARADVIA